MAGRFRTPCKFFLQGQCRNGDACKFSHERPFSGRASSGRSGESARSNGNGPFGDNNSRRNTFGGGARGGSSPFGGGTGASSGASGAASDTVRLATIEELRNPSLWPLSGFAVNKALPNVVGGDLSAEEVRWEAYEQLKSTGNCTQHLQKVQTLIAESRNQRERVAAALDDPKQSSS
ncbi:hypothetical protein P43SY_001642 [Pythium insidiosum]|uniref:C3H1-type domain-containing protein n=1 Tax=Pythium insidiosum TaxID=114742 RepID=A0AAD5LNX6_PYTIN|nr:hypothetical protein P43SY_001642 [Pythium insidiosum]